METAKKHPNSYVASIWAQCLPAIGQKKQFKALAATSAPTQLALGQIHVAWSGTYIAV
jgi:hypothetical protein